QDTNAAVVELVQRLEEVLGAPAPPAELGDEHGINLARLSHRHDLLALLAIVASPRGLFHKDADDLVAGALGEGPEVSLLPLTRLVVGQNSAVNGNPLSHLIPLHTGLKTPRFVGLFTVSHYIMLTVVKQGQISSSPTANSS